MLRTASGTRVGKEMFDHHSKLIPALVHKNVDNDFEISIHKFERTVQVHTFHPTLKETLMEEIVYETQSKFTRDDENVQQFTSSVYIRPKMRVDYSSSIEIRRQPRKTVIYMSGLTVFRRFVFEYQPFVEVLGKNEQNESEKVRDEKRDQPNPAISKQTVVRTASEPITYETTLSFDI